MDSYYARAMKRNYRRKLEVKRNIILLLCSIIVILAITFLATSIHSQASDSDHQVSYKYYKSIMIERGDTLWSIAEQNMDKTQYASVNDYIAEIKSMNSLSSNSIKAGSYLIIPYFSTEFKQS